MMGDIGLLYTNVNSCKSKFSRQYDLAPAGRFLRATTGGSSQVRLLHEIRNHSVDWRAGIVGKARRQALIGLMAGRQSAMGWTSTNALLCKENGLLLVAT